MRKDFDATLNFYFTDSYQTLISTNDTTLTREETLLRYYTAVYIDMVGHEQRFCRSVPPLVHGKLFVDIIGPINF